MKHLLNRTQKEGNTLLVGKCRCEMLITLRASESVCVCLCVYVCVRECVCVNEKKNIWNQTLRTTLSSHIWGNGGEKCLPLTLLCLGKEIVL